MLLEERISVPAMRSRHFRFEVRQHPVFVDCRFQVVQGNSGLRMALARGGQMEKLLQGRPPRLLRTTDYQQEGRLRYLIREAGDYVVILDNAMEGRGAVTAEVKVELDYESAAVMEPRTLPRHKRRVVVALSLVSFSAIAGWAGWRILGAVRRRNSAPPPLSC